MYTYVINFRKKLLVKKSQDRYSVHDHNNSHKNQFSNDKTVWETSFIQQNYQKELQNYTKIHDGHHLISQVCLAQQQHYTQ